MAGQYWLLKSEPGNYSVDDLKRDRSTYWEGVRNYQARNFLRDSIKKGDEVFFYHSNADLAGIAGVAKVTSDGYPDPSQFDPKSKYFDPKSSKEKPLWYVVDIQFSEKFPAVIPLENLKKIKALEGMPLLQRGQRLSVQPVTRAHWKVIFEEFPGR
ncbi:MAG: EVE domain-containing protein [Candidatus Omnitrophota bacterium]|nr:EVE domain-containing protein [Candidatus Omnitrophota bacterium]